MKKLITALTMAVSLLFASPALAYTVKSGDTMCKIARENGLTLQELEKHNPQVQNLDIIYIGETIHTSPTVTVANYSPAPVATPLVNKPYSDYDIDLLARLVRAEAQGEPFGGKVAVANVVLNRVESTAFPDTIEGVIYQKGQFQPVRNGQINKPADEESIHAVSQALSESRDITNDSLYFYNPDTATSRWLDSRQTTLVIGNHVFKR
ncbi:cell wall hydrolase [Neobacillus sp. Marseille-QA0830]